MLNAIAALNNGQNSFAHYTFRENKIFARTYGPKVGSKKVLDEFLSSLARRVQIPDVDFIMNLDSLCFLN